MEIREGYRAWADDPRRKASKEVDFGVHWTLDGHWPTWRVSWIEETGELYARELDGGDRYILLGVFPKREEVETFMEGWAEGPHILEAWFGR